MLELSHYHSLDEVLERAPPIDAICHNCKSLNFVDLFSGPRYNDFDLGFEKPGLDVFVGTIADIRRSADECRVCYLMIAFHDAKHVSQPDCTAGAREHLERCILKPYRTDALLHMKDESIDSQKGTIATSLSVTFQNASKWKLDGTYIGLEYSSNMRDKGLLSRAADAMLKSSRFLQKSLFSGSKTDQVGIDAVFGNTMPECVPERASSGDMSDGQGTSSSESDDFERRIRPLECSKSAYCVHQCFFSLTPSSAVPTRPTLSISNSARGSAIDWSSLRRWLQACEIDHPGCGRDHGSLPADSGMRIHCIDVTTSQIVPVGFQTRYLALSYVWGAAHREVVGHIRRSIIKDNSTVITKNLPPIVRDAIRVTRKMRERYLWVDCVCIDQNDAAAMQEQIGLMDRIYENALFTIITSASDNIYDEIPGVRPASRLKSSSEVLMEGRLMKAICSTTVVGEFYGIWRTRGWTFQEWLLSKRCLFFSTDQIMFRCQESAGLESFTPPRANPSSNNSSLQHFWADHRSSTLTLARLPLGTPSWIFQTYADLVRDYTNRILTYDSDVLHAFTGLMRKMERSCGMSFVEGLPEADLSRALLWSSTLEVPKQKQSSRRLNRPSWAWSAYGYHSGYLCWEAHESAAPGTAAAQRYASTISCSAPRSERARVWSFASQSESHEPVLLSIGLDFAREPFGVLCEAIRYRRADLALSPLLTGRPRCLVVSSETRELLIHQNPPQPPGYKRVNVTRSRDDVLHPTTRKLLDGRHFEDTRWRSTEFGLFPINVGFNSSETFLSRDAILLYEWDMSGTDGKWHQKVVAMIIERLSGGTAERLSLTAISSEDWYTLPLVSEHEDVVLV